MRERGGTPGERQAAAHLLQRLLAKHNLTESDIPRDDERSHARSYWGYEPPPRYTRRRPPPRSYNRPPPRQPPPRTGPDQWEEFRRRAQQQADDFAQQQREHAAGMGNPFSRSIRTKGRVKWQGELFVRLAKAYKHPTSTTQIKGTKETEWTAYFSLEREREQFVATYTGITVELKRKATQSRKLHAPKNPNAFNRAYFAGATHRLVERLMIREFRDPHARKYKDKNAYAAGYSDADAVIFARRS